MRIISFAWTLDAVLAGRKTKTRRYWNDDYAKRFKKGDLVAGYDRLPRVGGSQKTTIQLTEAPYKQRTSLMTEQDFEDEGLKYMEEQDLWIQLLTPRQFFENWQLADEELWVISFKLME